MKINSNWTLQLLYILSWILFIGLCVDAGSFWAYVILTWVNPADVKFIWEKVDLAGLYSYDRGHFFAETLIIGMVAVMRALLFYLIVKLFHDRKLNMTRPFNQDLGRFIFRMSYVCMLVGVFSYWGINYAGWLVRKGVKMPDAPNLQLGGADVWLFMGVTLLVISQIIKKGIEMQTENELTV